MLLVIILLEDLLFFDFLLLHDTINDGFLLLDGLLIGDVFLDNFVVLLVGLLSKLSNALRVVLLEFFPMSFDTDLQFLDGLPVALHEFEPVLVA